MAQARPLRWLNPALLAVLAILAATAARGGDASTSSGRPFAAEPLAVVSWPPSNGLLVSEVVTGSGSASDEFVEIYNAASTDLDLGGLELVYVSSSGSTVTRKQTWTQLSLGAHRHLLLANSAGKWASGADGLYSGGFAATGGGLLLRTLAGSVIDSLSWGDAASAFVEGDAGPAPSAGSSLERQPGGASGNATDTNDNFADTRVESDPQPQPSTSGPTPATTPAPTTTPSPTAGASQTAAPSPTPTPMPTEPCTPSPSPSPSASPSPSPDPTPSPTTEATVSPTPAASPTPAPASSSSPGQSSEATDAPTAEPTPEPTPPPSPPTPSPTPSPTVTPTANPVISIATARSMPMGTSVVVGGTLTTPIGLIDAGATAFIEDASAGIALRLDAANWEPLPVGIEVTASGVLESRDGLLIVSLEDVTGLAAIGTSPLVQPISVVTGLACEPLEARTVVVEGWITVAAFPTESGAHVAVIDDGTGPLTIMAEPGSTVIPSELALGARVRLTGVIGQYDPLGTGLGYRLYLRSLDDVAVLEPPPTPSPTPSPSPTPTPTATPSPSQTPAILTVAAARTRPIGTEVHVRGVVTVGAGWILGDSTVAIQDSTGGIYLRLADPALDVIVPGRLIQVHGTLADPFGNLELRPVAGGVDILAMTTQPSPRPLSVAEIGESTEGLIAGVSGTIRSIEVSSTGSVTVIVADESGEGRVFAHAPLGLTREDFAMGSRVSVIGLVGDRLGLYRLWPRNCFDIVVLPTDPSPTPTSSRTPTQSPTRTATPTPTTSGHPSPSPTPRPSDDAGPAVTIADALRRQGQTVTIEGAVTTRPGLLDADGLRVAVQDATGAILVRLPTDVSAQTGQRLRLVGEVGTYYGAPQLTAETATRSGETSVEPLSVRAAPFAAGLEWRLVTITGQVESVRRDGETWRAEIALGGGGVPVVGLERSGIDSTALIEGRSATVIGVVKRAYPTATDQRLALVPRSPSDIRLGAGPAGSSEPANGPGATSSPGAGSSPRASIPLASGRVEPGQPSSYTVVTALADLSGYEGSRVAVGGWVRELDGTRVTLDDGSGTAVIRLAGEAAGVGAFISVGDLINARGVVERAGAAAWRSWSTIPGRSNGSLRSTSQVSAFRPHSQRPRCLDPGPIKT